MSFHDAWKRQTKQKLGAQSHWPKSRVERIRQQGCRANAASSRGCVAHGQVNLGGAVQSLFYPLTALLIFDFFTSLFGTRQTKWRGDLQSQDRTWGPGKGLSGCIDNGKQTQNSVNFKIAVKLEKHPRHNGIAGGVWEHAKWIRQRTMAWNMFLPFRRY